MSTLEATLRPVHSGSPAGDAVHLWFLATEASEREQPEETALPLLSPDELARYRAFGQPAGARRFLLGRALMRRCLAAHLDADPARLRFTYGRNGKPQLRDAGPEAPAFSMSHTRSGAVMAIARAEALGVDLEQRSRASKVLRVARSFFSRDEALRLQERGDRAADEALALWGLKESVAKALDGTIWDALSGVSLALDGRSIRWLSEPPGDGEGDWRLLCGRAAGDLSIALALKRRGAASHPLEVVTHGLPGPYVSDTGVDLRWSLGPVIVR